MYLFIQQCKFCGEPIEQTDDLFYCVDRNGHITCEKVYPEYRNTNQIHYHTLGK